MAMRHLIFVGACVLAAAATTPSHSEGQSTDDLSALNQQVAVLYQSGKYAEAITIAQGALAIAERLHGSNHPRVAVGLSNLALLLQVTNRLTEAERLYRRALEIDETSFGLAHPKVACDLNNLAGLLQATNRLTEAEHLYRRGLAINERSFGPAHPEVARVLNDLAQLLHITNRLAEAEPLMRRALEINEKSFGPAHPKVATALNILAALLHNTNRLTEAEPLMRRALAIDEKSLGPEHSKVALRLRNLGSLRADRGAWAEAAELYLRAVPIMTAARSPERGADRIGRAKAALTANTWGLRAAARAVYRANRGKPEVGDEAFQIAQWAVQTSAANALAQMAARFAEGVGPLSELVGRHQDLLAKRNDEDKRLLSAVGAGNAQAAVAIRQSLAAIDAELDAIDKSLADQFPDYTALSNPKPLDVAAVQALLEPDETLVLLLDVPRFGRQPEESLVWAVTKTQMRWVGVDLGTQELIDRVQALRCGLDEEEWVALKQAERCAQLLNVDQPGEGEALPFSFAIAHELYEKLLAPVQDLIKDKHLIIVLSGALTSLPFQVLVTAPAKAPIGFKYEDYRDVAWLAQEQAITVLPSVASLKALRSHAKESPATAAYVGYGDPLLIGNPDCAGGADVAATCPGSAALVEVASVSPRRGRRGLRSARLDRVFRKGGSQEAVLTEVRGLCPLPDTAQEIRCVAQSLGVPDSEIRLKETATEADIKALSENGKLATYKVIHFATHGLIAGDVEVMAKRQGEPALVLTPPKTSKDAKDEDDNGLLTASEVTQLKLNADWVILSACNTAAGEKLGAEALSGLARAFFFAGARALLVSHWPVYSDAAVRLITGTFAELKADPEIGRAEAQRRAIVALMSDPSQEDNLHPSVWAPFVVVGEGAR
jgi:CHAT domain-containing protein/tetratricopeptide (TPR) repeat protein